MNTNNTLLSDFSSITINNITKIYFLYFKPVDRLKEIILRRSFHQKFTSLNDISLIVNAGESIGIIGDNGAGKSTLLKILAGTLSPTSGSVHVKGRVAALLELGAGFHLEFTGRQNIFLNASLIGLSEDEIKAKQSDIIEFAELDQFIDQPLKTYSSGMIVRLAFSIATSIDPDVLIIDEALSVGDQYFQKKCKDRILEFKAAGKTIFFCSHSMYMVNLLCDRAIWIANGKLIRQGEASEVTAAYENYLRDKEKDRHPNQDTETNTKKVMGTDKFIESIVLNEQLEELKLNINSELRVLISLESLTEEEYKLGVGIKRNDGIFCYGANLSGTKDLHFSGKGKNKILVKYPQLPFLHGVFYIVVFLFDKNGFHIYDQKNSKTFTIIPEHDMTQEVGLFKLPFTCKLV